MAVTKLFKKKTLSKGIFQPPRLKFKKLQKSPIRSYNYSFRHQFSYGSSTLKSLAPVFLGPKQLEIARRFITRQISRTKKNLALPLLMRSKPTRPITRKGRGVRMGKGKGIVKYWVAPEFVGMNIIELGNYFSGDKWLKHVSKKLAGKSCILIRKSFKISTHPQNFLLPDSLIQYNLGNSKKKLFIRQARRLQNF